jgi:hypothetical protein
MNVENVASHQAPGFDLRTVQPVPNRYIDYAIPAHLHYQNCDCLFGRGGGGVGVGDFLDWKMKAAL